MERTIKAIYGWLRLQMPWNAHEKRIYNAFQEIARKEQEKKAPEK